MGFLIFLLLVSVLAFVVVRGTNGSSSVSSEEVDAKLTQRNYEWAQFIANYLPKARSKAEKSIIQRMLADIAAKGLPIPTQDEEFDASNDEVTEDANKAGVIPIAASVVQEPKSFHKEQLDNISLLLYLGAFLFVASAGLFVALGGISGGLKTLIVLIVVWVFYFGGLSLYRRKEKFRPAGLAFVAIGMAIAPLVGLAAYNYAFSRSNGELVWFATSVFCLGLYTRALFALRTTFTGYLLVFTFLSLFESGVSILQAPMHFFVWGLAIVGLILYLVGRSRNFGIELQTSSRVTSQLLIPLAVVTSITILPAQGAGQFAVSSILAGIFYGLMLLAAQEQRDRHAHALAAQGFLVLGVAVGMFAITERITAVSVAILLMVYAQVLALYYYKGNTTLWQNFASLVVTLPFFAFACSLNSRPLMLASSISLLVVSTVVTWLQRRIDVFGIAGLTVVSLPILIGQVILAPAAGAFPQALMSSASLFGLCALLLWLHDQKKSGEWIIYTRAFVITAGVVPILISLFGSGWLVFALCLAVASIYLLLAEFETYRDWGLIAGVLLLVPVFRNSAHLDSVVFAVSTLTALGYNIVTALRYRQELNRWVSTALWLFVPVALGNGALGSSWSSQAFAWAYVVIMIALLFSRAVARGAVFVSGKAPLTSFAQTASMSYVWGYSIAAALAGIISLNAPDSRIHTSLILGVFLGASWILTVTIERKDNVIAAMPLLMQVLVWSVIRPELQGSSMTVFLLTSMFVAAGGYLLFKPKTALTNQPGIRSVFAATSLLMTLVAPLSILIIGNLLWPMPVGLVLAGALLMLEVWRGDNQEYREVAASVILLGFLWFLYFLGVRNVQVFSHLIAVLLGIFAWWRNVRADRQSSDNYLLAMLSTATIPLASQAITLDAGGLYGWWLLLEQIGFILLGMSIARKTVVWWGLWVAVGAVLFQLRGLGWAMLAVLALFVIGIGVYKLSRMDNDTHK